MDFARKFGILCLIIISVAYVYFSFFSKEEFNFDFFNKNEKEDSNLKYNPEWQSDLEEQAKADKSELKTVKVYVTDSKGNLRSVNRNCDTSIQKSCFSYAIKQLISAPTKWEKSRGLSSEIPSGTRILSLREGENNVLIDLSSNFESGGGAESIYIRVHQLIKTANANTKLPVFLYINGKQADVIGGEGIMIKQPLNERSLNE